MEIRRLLYVVANCVLYCVAKPVSLNEIIAAESQQKQVGHTFVHTTTSPKLEEPAAERISLNRGLKPFLRSQKKLKKTDSITLFGKKISPLKYRKTFQIKSPLRPTRLKHSLRSRNKRKNQSVKREVSGNEKLNQKYIPLLRNLGMLFDNLLGTDSSESAELGNRRKRVRYYTDTSEILCPCSSKPKQNAGPKSEKTAITSAEIESAEASLTAQTSPETPHPTSTRYFRRFGQNKNIPILLPRNPVSRRRDHNGFSERSRAAHNRSDQRNIPRDNGDSQHHPGNGSDESDAENDEEDPDDDTRYSSSGVGHRGGIRRNKHTFESFETRDETERSESDEADQNEIALERPRGIIKQLEGKDQQQIRGIKAESAELLPIPNGGTRKFIPQDEVNVSEFVHTEESDSEQSGAFYQQPSERSSTPTQEIKETSSRIETINIPTITPINPKIDPVVFIIDGYSVTRNKNGENKLKEKAIRIHSK